MKKTGIAAGLLAAALLAGCAAQDPAPAAAGEHDIVREVLGVPGNTAILTIDDTEVEAERYLFWLVNAIETWKYRGYALETDEDWIQQVSGVSIRDAIKAVMGPSEELHAGEYKVTWKIVTASRLDTAALRKAVPDVAAAFTRTTTTRRFCVA